MFTKVLIWLKKFGKFNKVMNQNWLEMTHQKIGSSFSDLKCEISEVPTDATGNVVILFVNVLSTRPALLSKEEANTILSEICRLTAFAIVPLRYNAITFRLYEPPLDRPLAEILWCREKG